MVFLQEDLLESEKAIVRMFGGADQALYDYFVKRLDDRIEAFGSLKMTKYVTQLRQLNKYVRKKCRIIYSKAAADNLKAEAIRKSFNRTMTFTSR